MNSLWLDSGFRQHAVLMNEDVPVSRFSRYGLDLIVDGVVRQRLPLPADKPTWMGRRTHESCADFEYIHLPGSRVRFHCLFEWDTAQAQFRVTTGGAAEVRINEELVGSRQQRLIQENDVICLATETQGLERVQLILVRMDPSV